MRGGMLNSGEETKEWAAKSAATEGMVLNGVRLAFAGRYNGLIKRFENYGDCKGRVGTSEGNQRCNCEFYLA